jgi:hypothetical protein
MENGMLKGGNELGMGEIEALPNHLEGGARLWSLG